MRPPFISNICAMLQLNRKMEYALTITAELFRSNPDELFSARQLSEATGVSYDMTTKSLQRLAKAKVCSAVQGKHGGYRLAIDCNMVSIRSYFERLGEPMRLTACVDDQISDCQISSVCTLRSPLHALNDLLRNTLDDLSLADLFCKSNKLTGTFSKPDIPEQAPS